MMWSMRTPPACRSTALTRARNGAYPTFVELIGPPRRLGPVLPELVVLIRWRAGADPERQHILQRPRVGAVGVHPDRQVVHDAQRHPGLHRGGLRRGQLVIEQPLQPAVEVDGLRVRGGERRDRRAVRVAEFRGPPMPVGAVHLGQCTPGGEVVEAAALTFPVAGVCQFAAGRTGHPVQLRQGRPLDLPRGVPVDPVAAECAGGQVGAGLAQRAPFAQERVLGNGFHAQVERVDEATGGGQVRRGFHRGHRSGRMQRVDQDESRPVPRRRPDGQIGEVSDISCAPGVFGCDAVQLGGQAPVPAGRCRQRGRGDDEHGAAVHPAALRVQPVIAGR